MDQHRVTVGILYPGSAAEDDYARMANGMKPSVDARIALTPVAEDAVTVDALKELGSDKHLVAGAYQISDTGLRSLMWACTSGSFLYGWAGAVRQSELLSAISGVPASSASLAFIAAIKHLGVSRVAVGAPYTSDITHGFVDFLAVADITVTSVHSVEAPTAAHIARFGRDEFTEITHQCDAVDAAAIVIPDTALHTVAWIEELERTLQKPILTSNQVSMWQALRLAGYSQPQPQFGTLLEDMGLPKSVEELP